MNIHFSPTLALKTAEDGIGDKAGSGEASFMLAHIENLREIAQRCTRGEPLGEDLSRWLSRSLDDFLSHRSRTLDDALGLKWPKGGVPWWLEEAMRRRDAALRELAERFCASQSICAQARLIRTAAMRYAASCWPIDRGRPEMPTGYGGRIHEWLWRAFKSGAPMPIGERQLRHVLAR